ncbi:hypothetical protein [Cellulomonas sp. KRMCY2]|uniref:hypothetical protein n=1 Tax=Cellulomonas sp. KRMCY2 TaxID=1304865 RepID=UPI00045EB70B|nr:hypothetical protein [Cellulomonas sp. KRMCY2]
MTSEYDAFGPWIHEVRTPEDVPRLYRDHPLDLASATLVLKVPRDILRRDADPSMDLYDHLIAVGQDALTILSRGAGGHATRVVPYDQILAIQFRLDMLEGRLVLHTAAAGSDAAARGPLTVSYNGSSHDVIEQLIELLRERYLPPADEAVRGSRAAMAPPLALLELGESDVALVTTQRGLLAHDPAGQVLATHRRRVVVPVAEPGVAGVALTIMHRLWPMTLQAAVVCGDDREIQVVHRKNALVRGRRPVSSVARTVVPRSRLDGVTARDHDRYAGVRVVSLHLAAASVDLLVPAGSDTEAALLGATVPSRG